MIIGANRIVFVFGYSLQIGGHFKSALAMAKYLVDGGRHVSVFAAPSGVPDVENAYRNVGADVVAVSALERRSRLPVMSGARQIAAELSDRDAQIVHAQDFVGLARAYRAATLAGLPLVYTQAGGAFDHRLPPRTAHTVVFSQELYDAYPRAYRTGGGKLHLIRARIDTDAYHPAAAHGPPVGTAASNGTGVSPEGTPRILLATRLDAEKARWIDAVERIVEICRGAGGGAHVVLAVYGECLSELKRRVEGWNAGGIEVARIVEPISGIDEMVSLYNGCDVVAGSGRGILEAMACGKPAFVLGETGEGEIVNAENVTDVAYYNFSGRHFRHRRGDGCDGGFDGLNRLLHDPRARAEAGDFSRSFIISEMEARLGADALAEVYDLAGRDGHDRPADAVRWFASVTGAQVLSGVRKRIPLSRRGPGV